MLEHLLKQGLFSPAGVRLTQRVLDSNLFANGVMVVGNGVIAVAKYIHDQHKVTAQQQQPTTMKRGV